IDKSLKTYNINIAILFKEINCVKDTKKKNLSDDNTEKEIVSSIDDWKNNEYIEDDLDNSSKLEVITNLYEETTPQDYTIYLADNLVMKWKLADIFTDSLPPPAYINLLLGN
ncbi:16230_t:CDS:2, partial [Dentiscutata heterogama]